MEERMVRINWDNYYCLTHGDDEGIAETVLAILENIEWDDLEPAPPKDWQQQRTTLKLQVMELEDANRHLAYVNEKLNREIKQKRSIPAYLDQALNEGDGVYRP
jgi:hypothetical protein